MVALLHWGSLVLLPLGVLAIPHGSRDTSITTVEDGAGQLLCRKPISPFDYSAKIRRDQEYPFCKVNDSYGEVSVSTLLPRQEAPDDYTCGEGRPCRNGACCPKETGQCNYGPKACGTNNISPNDVCWSNCDAKAECGRYSDPPNKECPLNVCCSSYGFCGTTEEFCKKTDDDETNCQSNCDQPGPKDKDGNVQKRIIGYYEAWNYNKSCVGMTFNDIPVDALTHAYFSFAYITPGDFKIAPMDDLPVELFDEFTNIKKRNAGLKAIVALGGWTFNDNNTATQPVFSNMVSSAANRKLFIGNLFGFMRKHAFDGVDFDWEYPGAGDRGGQPDDGKNFVQFLKELDDINNEQPTKYSVSFTIPTSYWYLRHFDLKAVDHVDFVNVMSYDLHGIWDATNPIGSHINAHSNLTEIKAAFDLLWRNDVPAKKLNLGLGFYGRSFTLTDPMCTTPGCGFRSGALPGSCSDNSGTLTFREIKQIIDDHKLKPYYDKDAAVKWITWNQDQWVSYDDAETFKQKIEWANNEGLSGLLIWAIDQDTQDLEALKGIVAPKSLKLFAKQAEKAAFWEDATVPDCYVTDCGGSCKPGWLSVEKQPCGGAKPVTRHSKEADSTLCCPMEGAPNKADCSWRGTAPSCNGHCHDNEVALELNRWGDGKYCEDGNKAYCCKSPVTEGHQCYWAGVGRSCNNDDVPMTFSGTFLQTIGDIVKTFGGLTGKLLVDALESTDIDVLKLYCCPKKDAETFQNCKWYGEPGSCYDNHCPVGSHSVQLTDSPYGLGEDCFPRVERTRVFCCDPANGESPFLPVSLDKLFPHPPEGDDIKTDHELQTDDTWGSGKTKNDGNEDPEDAAFSFVVLTSPDELQVSLDKRDGSHWDLFNCTDTDSEEEQTIQMVCTDVSETSNCHKIGLGHGAPGTILQMPSGCGPGKYAVAKEMKVSKHQILPRSLTHLAHKPVIYDLTFDYDFTRVPRDLGNTQLRIDYSNEAGYWDEVVAAAVSKKKRKRSMAEVGHSHKRWLEEEFRDDLHFGGLSKEEFHKRWFGESVLEWLRQMIKPEIKKTFQHNLDETYTAKIVEERWSCPGRDGYLLAQAQAHIKVGTSFGFTLIASSLSPLDLSDSFLVFTNDGEITCTFTLEALVRFQYDTKEFGIGPPIPFPGSGLRIPGIATIGPQLALRGRVEAGVAISATLEAKLDVVSWEYEYRLPAEMKPENPDKAEYGKTGDKNGLLAPTFYAGVSAQGNAKAHLIAALEFGVNFDKRWDVSPLVAQVAADSWVEAKIAAGISTKASCPFTWGLDAGVDLYAKAEGFKWTTGNFPLPGSAVFHIYEGGQCPDLTQGGPSKRDVLGFPEPSLPYWESSNLGLDTVSHELNQELAVLEGRSLQKRAIGPFFHIPAGELVCPSSEQNGANTPCSQIVGWETSQFQDSLKRRDVLERSANGTLHFLGKRVTETGRTVAFCKGSYLTAPPYETSGTLSTKVTNLLTFDYDDPDKCNNFGFGQKTNPRGTDFYATEHILELQTIANFLDEMNTKFGKTFPNYKPDSDPQDKQDFCSAIKTLWKGVRADNRFTMDGVARDPIDFIMPAMPSNINNYVNEFVLLENGVNTAKKGMWSTGVINTDDTMTGYIQSEPARAIKNLKDVISAMKYLQDSTINTRLKAEKERIAARLKELDEVRMPNFVKKTGSKSWSKWTSKGLESEWNTFIKQRATNAKDKAVRYIEDNIQKMKDGYTSDANKEASKTNPELKTLIEKIEKLEEEWNRYKPNSWQNPF
ncbi:glycosyl hydrolases family 18-domain-containing protein [Annulohypoxylon nitens]|nr:glycosyl hydrolases family 18-domain-containing protein [Annulohypoxylon nitens]